MSNLPPGVSINDIPGNRPEDIEYERKWDRLYELWQKNKVAAPLDGIIDEDWFIDAVDIAMEFAYTTGYKDGIADQQLNDAIKHGDEGI